MDKIVNGTPVEMTPQELAELRSAQAQAKAESASKRQARRQARDTSLALLIAATGMTREQLKEAIDALGAP